MCAESQPPVVSARFADLDGKVAIVTGASRGIGRATARFLAAQGMKVAATGRREEVRDEILAEMSEAGRAGAWITADAATDAGARSIFDAAMAQFGRIDLLVGSAADKSSKPFLDLDEASYRQSFETNVRIIYGLSRLVARQMVEGARGGSIVHISSVGGLRPHRGTVGYDMSKAAIDHMARAMAVELGPHGIRVNAVAPGWIPTPAQWARATDRTRSKIDGIPLRRAGTGEDVAAAVAFLASDAAAYITGQVLYVDGGLTTQLTPSGNI